MKKLMSITWLFGCLICCFACQQPKNKEKVRYVDQNLVDFPYVLHPEDSYRMPPILKEISGITFGPGNSDVIYAIQDEAGTLFTYDLSKKELVSEYDFATSGDYEDVATNGKFFYVLKSNGDLYTFSFDHQEKGTQVNEFKGLLPKGEYESLAIDSLGKFLYVVCKECKVDKKMNRVTGYILNTDDHGNLALDQQFTIDIKAVSNLEPKIGKRIRPSAMARRVSTNEWYIISSIDKILLITDNAFQPKKVLRFSRKDFEQPEGIAFDKHENLFISSEAGQVDAGIIYQFKNEKR